MLYYSIYLYIPPICAQKADFNAPKIKKKQRIHLYSFILKVFYFLTPITKRMIADSIPVRHTLEPYGHTKYKHKDVTPQMPTKRLPRIFALFFFSCEIGCLSLIRGANRIVMPKHITVTSITPSLPITKYGTQTTHIIPTRILLISHINGVFA